MSWRALKIGGGISRRREILIKKNINDEAVVREKLPGHWYVVLTRSAHLPIVDVSENVCARPSISEDRPGNEAI